MVYNFPANKVVAEFIGSPSMNFFEGKFVKEDDKAFVIFSDRDSFFIKGKKELESEDKEIIFGVRPEDVIISLEKKQGWFSGTVFATEPLGNATYVDIQWNMNRLKAEADPDFEAKPDSVIYFTFKEEKIHLFDRTDGRRLKLSSS
jgi:multiple sugar transport system ATP-binding protein